MRTQKIVIKNLKSHIITVCRTAKEAANLLGVSPRQITRYLESECHRRGDDLITSGDDGWTTRFFRAEYAHIGQDALDAGVCIRTILDHDLLIDRKSIAMLVNIYAVLRQKNGLVYDGSWTVIWANMLTITRIAEPGPRQDFATPAIRACHQLIWDHLDLNAAGATPTRADIIRKQSVTNGYLIVEMPAPTPEE